jgi:HPt (histidine-containing phosphotransfer) domain-containing protein
MHLDTVLNTWVRDKQDEKTLKKAEIKLADIKNEKKQETSCTLDNVSLTGIDIAQGLERYNGEAMYLEILRAWHTHTPALLETMKNKFSPENLADYAIAVHGIKGSSYGILANDVGKKAQELEAFAKANDFANVQALHDDFNKMVEALLAELGALQQNTTAGQAKQKKHEPDPALLAQLLEAARQYKAAIMEEILDKIESYDYESGGELIIWLREQMDNLEYDEICAKLDPQK